MTATPSMRLLARLMIHHPEDAPPGLRRLVAPPPPPEPEPEPPPPTPPAIKPRPEAVMTLPGIVAMVAWFYGIDSRELRYGGRFRHLAYPRFIAFHLTESMLGMTRAAIARRYSQDHSSVCNGLTTIRGALAGDDRLRDEIDVIRLHLLEHIASPAPGMKESRLAQYIGWRYRSGRSNRAASYPD